MDRGESKKTILHLPPAEAQDWCDRVSREMTTLWMKETLGRSSLTKYAALSLQTMMRDRRKTANPHLKRAQELRDGDCDLTRDLGAFVLNMSQVFKGERRSPFEEQMTEDDARSWLARTRRDLKRKIKRERSYRAAVPYPDENAATEEETVLQQEVLLLLNELIKTYPPKRLPRPKKEKKQHD
jgi:hypothetical protein